MREWFSKLKILNIKTLLYIGLVGILMAGCNYLNRKFHLDDDNLIEEAIEGQIKENTGIDVDLTPSTPEK